MSRNVYTNEIELDSVEYITTYIYKYADQNGNVHYSVIAPDEYSGEAPVIFAGQEDWQKCLNATKLVEQTIGDGAVKAELE